MVHAVSAVRKVVIWGGAASVLAILITLVFLIYPGRATAPSFTNSVDTELEFSRTVFDEQAASELSQLPETIAFAGPLFRPDGQPIELFEMTSDLELKGSRELADGFFYASATTAQNEITFMGGGCADPSGAWANCSVVNTISKDSETPDVASEELGLDFHEYEPDGNGGYWAIKYTSIPCETDNSKNCGLDASGVAVPSIGDCHIVHVVDGVIVSNWSAYEALPDGETTGGRYQQYQDVFHCNSIESFTLDNKLKLLVSMRNTDALYLIDAETGDVDWKLGGNNWAAESLKVTNPGTLGITSAEIEPGDVLSGQHDARYWGEGLYSVFDNGSNTSRPARGILFTVDSNKKTATILKVFSDPAGQPSGCTGSFTPLADGAYWIAGWGCSSSGVTVFKSDTTPVVSTQLDQAAESTSTLTDSSFGPIRWALSYRVVVE
jgi:hypothetical protein